MELLVCIGCAAGDDLRLARWRRMLHAHLQAAPADRIAQPAFLVDDQHDERNTLRLDRAEFRNRQLPGRKDFEQHRLQPFG